jgi:hypothetical protein
MAHVEHSSRGFGRDRYDAKRDSHTERHNADRSTDSKDTSADRRDR